jgi:hypothetical protein
MWQMVEVPTLSLWEQEALAVLEAVAGVAVLVRTSHTPHSR